MREKTQKPQIVNESENTEVFVRTNNEKAFKKPNKKKIIIIILAIVLVLTAAGVYASKSKPDPGMLVSTGTAEKVDLEQTVSIKGTIEGSDSADVASALNYRITSVLVQEGDVVSKDQVLATLDVEDLQNQYNKDVLSLNEAKRAYEAAQTLVEEGAMAKDEYLKLKAAYDAAAMTLSAYDIGDKKNIKSPIAGTVTRVNVTVGRYASDTENNQPMFVVENLADLQMKVRISEYDISKIKVGQSVNITAEVLGNQSVTGVVSKISPTGEAKDQTTAEKVVPVVIDVDKGDSNLIAGVTAKATILIEKKENVLTVPIDAILEDPETGETGVFTVREGLLHKIPVEIGLESTLQIEVKADGLSPGDKVVLAPTFEMTDGAKAIEKPAI